ncbi:MAG: superoxide dismutase, partial [Micavibrio sp.]|nr:superoxide dismutase [Micavibrio sp.]
GFVVMRKAPRGVMVTLSLSKLASGWHGVHVHTNPDCTFTQISPFAASGDHFGAEGLSHGFMTGGGPQNGDLPNVWIASNGTGRAEFYSNLIDFEDVVKDKGRSILIDASADDHINQPSGSSGIHVACGVLRREAPDKN